MKKLIFLLLCVLTYYIAGMYQYFPLMVLVLMELLLALVMYFLPRYFKYVLSAKILKKSDYAEKETDLSCSIQLQNEGRLPVSCLKIKMRFGYQNDSRLRSKSMYGGSPCGISTLQFAVNAQYCGLIQLRMASLRIYDYMTLFSTKKRLNEKLDIAVFPKEKMLHIELPSPAFSESGQVREQRIGNVGESHNEIRQLREYQEGDSSRYIHWNLSARTDTLWIKEYEKDAASMTEILLDSTGFAAASAADLDPVYELLSAMVLGLLDNVPLVRVHWYDGKRKDFACADITGGLQCREMLLQLYRMDFQVQETEADREGLKRSAAGILFRLDIQLRWYLGDRLIFQFQKEGLEGELMQRRFIL